MQFHSSFQRLFNQTPSKQVKSRDNRNEGNKKKNIGLFENTHNILCNIKLQKTLVQSTNQKVTQPIRLVMVQ